MYVEALDDKIDTILLLLLLLIYVHIIACKWVFLFTWAKCLMQINVSGPLIALPALSCTAVHWFRLWLSLAIAISCGSLPPQMSYCGPLITLPALSNVFCVV